MTTRRLDLGFATVRDLVTFGLGVGILVYSIVVEPPPPEPLSVGVGVALVGVAPVAALAQRTKE